MDAKPLKTHIRSFLTFRIIGTILVCFGGSITALAFFDFVLGLLMKFSFSSIFAQNESLAADLDRHGTDLIVSGLIIGILFLVVFAAGIVFLALSTRSKIKDANRGVRYDRIS